MLDLSFISEPGIELELGRVRVRVRVGVGFMREGCCFCLLLMGGGV